MAETEQLRKMFVGGLNWETDEESLRKYFSQWGNIIDCIIMLKPDKTSRGFGFVTFDKAKCVDECLKVRKHELDGRQIEPKRAVPKDEVNNPSVYQKTKKIFVGGLASTTTEEDIEEYFNKLLSEFGEGKIVDIELKRDRETNRIRGFAYVTFDSDEVVEKMVSMRNHEIKMKHCDVKKAESQAQLRRKQELEGNYRPKFSSYQGSASRERSSNSNSMSVAPSQNMAGLSMGNWGPGFFGGYFGGGVPGQGGFGGPGRGSDSDSGGRGQGSGSGSSGGNVGNWGLGNWGGPGANFGAGPMGFPGFGPGFGGFGGFPFGFGGMGYGPGFGAGYGAGFGYGGFGPGGSGGSSGTGMGGGGFGSSGSGGGSSSYSSGGSGPGGYGIKSEGETSSSYSSSERSTAGAASSVAGRESSGGYGYGFGYGSGMAGQQDWSSLAGFAGYGNYPGMVSGGVGDSKAGSMVTAATGDPYQLGSYNQANSAYGPTGRGAAGRASTTDVGKRVFRPY